MNLMLQCEGIQKRFGNFPVLRDVAFQVGPGRTLGLVGENGSGKSTLMNILGGNVQPDAGKMILDHRPYAPAHPKDASRAGVAFIHQELNLFPNLSIAENLFLTAMPRAAGILINRRTLKQRAAALLEQVGLDLRPETPVERLSPGERQLVEIARALSFDARLIIFDEPTTSLSLRETEILFSLIARLRRRGIAMIYISHILEHVLRLSDDLLVLRDGKVLGSGPAADFSTTRLVSLMVGREMTQLYPSRKKSSTSTPALDVEGVSEPGMVRDISFKLHRGEVLGLSGLMGAGRSELARILFGLDPHTTGVIRLNGQPLNRSGPRHRIQHGMAFLTEDRRHEGLCLDASIDDNLMLVAARDYAKSPFRLVQWDRWQQSMSRLRDDVMLPSQALPTQPVKILSGGNQQKVVLAKWLLSRPSVLILDEPTRGVDVGAKYELYRIILDLADEGTAALLISSEIEELAGLCDRILVMSQGTIRREFMRAEFDREQLLAAALPREARS